MDINEEDNDSDVLESTRSQELSRVSSPETPLWSPITSEDEKEDEEMLDEDSVYEDQPLACINELMDHNPRYSLTNEVGVVSVNLSQQIKVAEAQSNQSVYANVSNLTTHEDMEYQISRNKWAGFKLVGDNVDKNVRSSF